MKLVNVWALPASYYAEMSLNESRLSGNKRLIILENNL
jgi:hypothetical protein